VLGALVCYDVEFPEPARVLATLGCGLIALCNGNMDPYGEVHRRAIVARAQENQLFVAMANRVGAGRDERFAGGSMVVGPDGAVLAELAGGEGVLSVGIDVAQVAACRRSYNYLEDRRVGLQGGIVNSAGGLFEYAMATQHAR
jgi:(R)-amidase